ncbi:unnamed protein product [Rhodiola kirilowii]
MRGGAPPYIAMGGGGDGGKCCMVIGGENEGRRWPHMEEGGAAMWRRSKAAGHGGGEPPVAGGGGGGGVALATSCPSGRSSCPNVHIISVEIDHHLRRLKVRSGCLMKMALRRCLAKIYSSPDRFSGFGTSFLCTQARPGQKINAVGSFGQSQHEAKSDPPLDRNFMAKLWVRDNMEWKARERMKDNQRRSRMTSEIQHGGRGLSGMPSTPEDIAFSRENSTFKQPPLSQSTTGYLKPTSPEEVQIATLLARSNLLITRDIEWANLALGFEQENRYAIMDVCYPQSPVGFIREQSNVIARQLLRLRRPFVASITDANGNELFRVRRPFWWVTSSIYADVNGKEIGVVHRRWHLWKRVYDLYLGSEQFAVVENPGFWYWTFTLKDINGNVLAEIDRNWRGFGFEILTDAGQYVIRFGSSNSSSNTGLASEIQELEVARPLTLSERAATLALAISLDNDYFSRHGGWGVPFFYAAE